MDRSNPAIAAAAAKLRAKSFTLDGETVVCGPDGVAVFDALHRRHKANDAILYTFDLLELDGADLRPMLARSNSDNAGCQPEIEKLEAHRLRGASAS